jgi:hypothetical protein
VARRSSGRRHGGALRRARDHRSGGSLRPAPR